MPEEQKQPTGLERGTLPEKVEREPQERRKLERDLCLSFVTLERYFNGGALSGRPAGYTENANVCILTRDNQGEFAAKLGWGDFALESDKGNPNQLKSIGGPAFVLDQFGAYMLNTQNKAQAREKPREYLFANARFIVDGKTIYAKPESQERLRNALSPETFQKIKFVDFDDQHFKEQWSVKDAQEYIRHLQTMLVREKIGVEKFEELIDALKQSDGVKTLMRLRRIYDRWLSFLTYFSDQAYRPNLHKDETAWQAELRQGEFRRRVAQLVYERGINTMRDQEGYTKAEIDALKEFDPDVAKDLELAYVIVRLQGLEIYHIEELLDFSSLWDRDKKEFLKEPKI